MVLFIGEIRAGVTLEGLKSDLAQAFGVNLARIEKLFTGRPEIIRNNLDEATAKRYSEVLKTFGAVCWVEPMPPFYRKYVDRRKNTRNRRTRPQSSAQSEVRDRMAGSNRRKKTGRRYYDK